MKIPIYLFIFFFTVFMLSCVNHMSEKSYKIDSSQVKSIRFFEMNEGEIIKEITIEDEKEIFKLISMTNNNTQFLTKFLPTYKADIVFKDKTDTLHIMFRDRYFKVNPGGTFKMKKSINETLKEIGK